MIIKEKNKWTAQPDPVKPSKFRQWMVWVPLAVLIFGGTFWFGYKHILDEPKAPEIAGFTADEANRMLARVQSDFDDHIAYQTSETSGPNKLATGEEYYTMFFIVTTENDPNVYKYVFWKYAADFEDHPKGDIVLVFNGITDEYSKEDVID